MTNRRKNKFMSSVMKLCNMNVDVWWDKKYIDNDTFSKIRRGTTNGIFYS